RLVVEIARRVPRATFVHLDTHAATPRLMSRLGSAFDAAGLSRDALCLLPRQPRAACLNLMAVSDVFLDSIAWSGNNTTMEAVAMGLPIVTWPQATLSGRHAFGILSALGVTDTVAQSGDEYVELAVSLGTDRSRRAEVSARMIAHHAQLFDDPECMGALEAFYQRAVEAARDRTCRGGGAASSGTRRSSGAGREPRRSLRRLAPAWRAGSRPRAHRRAPRPGLVEGQRPDHDRQFHRSGRRRGPRSSDPLGRSRSH